MLHQYRSLEALEDKYAREKIIVPMRDIMKERPGGGPFSHGPARILPAEAGGLEHSIITMARNRPGLRKGPELSIGNLTKAVMPDSCLVKQCDIMLDGETIGTLTIKTRKVQGGMRILDMNYYGTIPGYRHNTVSDRVLLHSNHDCPIGCEGSSRGTDCPNNTEENPLYRRDYHHQLALATHEYHIEQGPAGYTEGIID